MTNESTAPPCARVECQELRKENEKLKELVSDAHAFWHIDSEYDDQKEWLLKAREFLGEK